MRFAVPHPPPAWAVAVNYAASNSTTQNNALQQPCVTVGIIFKATLLPFFQNTKKEQFFPHKALIFSEMSNQINICAMHHRLVMAVNVWHFLWH